MHITPSSVCFSTHCIRCLLNRRFFPGKDVDKQPSSILQRGAQPMLSSWVRTFTNDSRIRYRRRTKAHLRRTPVY
jgi:hypothetical protein